MGNSLLVVFAFSGISLLRDLWMMKRDAGSSLEAYLVSDQGF